MDKDKIIAIVLAAMTSAIVALTLNVGRLLHQVDILEKRLDTQYMLIKQLYRENGDELKGE